MPLVTAVHRVLFCALLILGLPVGVHPFDLRQEGVDSAPNRTTARHGVTIYGSESERAVADSVLAAAHAQLTYLLRDSLSFTSTLQIVREKSAFDALVGSAFPDWGGAAAIPSKRLMVVKSPNFFNLPASLEELIVHEYAHLALSYRLRGHPAPRWFDEGLAQSVSTVWGIGGNVALTKATVLGNHIPLSSIDGVNGFHSFDAELAYATSFQAVQFLRERFGQAGIDFFIDALASGQPVGSAIELATGRTWPQFEAEFHLYLQSRFTVTGLLIDMSYLWLLFPFLLIAAWLVRLWQKQQYAKKWKRQEQLESTDFDYGDPNRPETPDSDDEPWRG